MRLITIIAFGIIGIFLGIGLFHLDDSGYFQHWQRLLAAPANISDIFSPESPQYDYPHVQYTKPCNYSSPEFSILANPPKNIVDCIQESEMYADGGTRSAQVIDRSENIWEWSHFTYAYDEQTKMILLPVFGCAIGIVIALFITKQQKKP